jgi:hypothetical protein
MALNDIRDELGVDLVWLRQKLIEAQARRKEKDTPKNRAAVAESWTRIDAVLDLLLEMRSTSLV